MDRHELAAAVDALSRAAVSRDSLDQILVDLCDLAAEALDVDEVGVMSHAEPRLRFVHTANPKVAGVAQLQEDLERGPCADAVSTGTTAISEDLAREPRWPQFAQAALDVGVRSVLAIPLVGRGRIWGTLDLGRTTAGAWSAQTIADATLLARVAVSYLVMMADRTTAEQARGDAEAARAELEHRSLHDSLTGLPNRALLFDRLEHALAAASRHGGAVTVVFIDLDGFKEINDSLGHAAGDHVLAEVAGRLSTVLRDEDTLGRLAGDEFVVVCETPPTGEASPTVLTRDLKERIRLALAEPIAVADVEIIVSASTGFAVSFGDGTPDALLAEADNDMYQEKRDRRRGVVEADGLQALRSRPGVLMGRDLSSALRTDQLTAHYQPIFEADGSLSAAEALLRWAHPTDGLLEAATFVGLAEDTGLLPAIGRQLIEQACKDLRRWDDAAADGSAAGVPERVFVNLSPRQVTDPRLLDAVTRALDENGVRADRLGFEVVEGSIVEPAALALLDSLREAGHAVAVDDFGTGFSSLSRLVRLPITHVKVDKSFINDLPHDERSRALVDAVLIIADRLHLGVIAEGIENQAQLEYLAGAGCSYLQGYHLGRPMPADQLEELLTPSVSR